MRKAYILITIAISLTAAIFIQENGLADQQGYAVGDVAKEFTLKNVDGKMVSLEDYAQEEGVILVFTCNTCPYAKLYESRIKALDMQYKSQGFPVVAIQPNDPELSPGDSFEEMQNRYKDKAMTYPYLWDETQEITRTYGATRTPHVYLLENTGDNFKVAYIGAIDDNHKDANAVNKSYVEDAITSIKAKRTVDPNFTKAIGCTIKWSE